MRERLLPPLLPVEVGEGLAAAVPVVVDWVVEVGCPKIELARVGRTICARALISAQALEAESGIDAF